ncbi:MAG: 6-carboxytetrahydropterin synthase [Candidatus Kapabacteria bacterium]|nr:6-carboxytetrahydropterin synthase [Candidatus Kapabacteria bacterium]MDW8224435.1 6-carboxytetrahydropterin synthase [Bacteroidota bacterium]
MSVRIAKEFRWEMAHRLPFHTCGCQNVHGHSYRAVVILEGEPDARGMVLDYLELARLVEPILHRLDHAFLCSEDDELMTDFLRQHPEFKAVFVPFVTTAENIAQWLLEQLATELRAHPNLQYLTVRVHETERTFAEVSLQLHPAPISQEGHTVPAST